MDPNSPQWPASPNYASNSHNPQFPSLTTSTNPNSNSGLSDRSPESANPSIQHPSIGAPSFFASDESWAYGNYDYGDDHGDPKRRRIARACDSCRRKKIKCDAKMPKCTHCENYKIECVFTHVEKKRAPPKGAKYIEGLENRLGRMEHLLRLSGFLTEEDEEGADLGTLEQRLAQQVNSSRESPGSNTASMDHRRSDSRTAEERRSSQPKSGVQSPAAASQSPRIRHGDQKVSEEEVKKDPEVDDLADMMWCSLVTNNQGETRFIGIQWVNEKTGDSSFPNMIGALSHDDNKWYPWREEVFGDIFARRVFRPLPDRAECESLMEEFFEGFNRMFPLFHEPTFMHLVDKQYSEEPYDGSGWWACLNVALAIAYRLRILKNALPQSCETQSWAYFKNALGVLSELTMRNTDLLSVQALIGMCLFLQGSPNPQPSFYLIGAAARLAHSIGLHKHGDGFGLNPVEIEQRKRVFWILYLIDKDICLRSGRPPAQDDDDWNVDLPSEDPDDGVGTIPLADGGKTNIFHTLCRFAVISAKVYNKLYSVRAARQSDGELLKTIGELDAELEEWKDSIPLDFRPAHELTALPPHLVIHIVMLHFAYYNCLTTIHRRSVHHGYWTSRLADYAVRGLNVKPLNPRVFSSAELCVSAARTSIHLIKYIPAGDYACVWLILYYPVSALVTLFANILQNPQDVRARADLKLINVVVQFLQKVSYEDTTGSIQRMCDVSRGFEHIAGIVLERAEDSLTERQKRKKDKEREKLAKTLQEPVEIPQPTRNSQEARRPDLQQLYDSQLRRFENGDGPKTAESSTSKLGQQRQPLKQPRPLARTNGFNPLSMLNSDFVNMPSMADANSPSFGSGQTFGQTRQTFSPNDFLTSPTDGGTPDFGSAPASASSVPNLDNAFNTQASFQQPMVPQELWNMPMTFEWDWANIVGNGFNANGMPNFMGGTPSANFDMMGFDNDTNQGMSGNAEQQDGI